jgi:hypothetical protein
MPEPEEVNSGRDNKKVYLWFCSNFMEAVVGSTNWKRNCARLLLSKIATVSDEAFAQLVYENNFCKWNYMHINGDKNDQTIGTKWTCGGPDQRHSKNKKFCGWSRAGLEQLNKNYVKVQRDRRDDRNFERKLLQYCRDNEKPKRITKKANKENELAGFKVLNSLPQAGEYDGEQDSDKDGEENGSTGSGDY